MTTTYSVGAAKTEITPPLTIPYLGYNPRHSFFDGVHDPLYARAVVVGEGDDRVAIIAVDSIGISRRVLGDDRDFIRELRQHIESACAIAGRRIMVNATHAHSTPDTAGFRRLLNQPDAAAWLESLRDTLAALVAEADRCRKPARLKTGACRVEGVGRSRRFKGSDDTRNHVTSDAPAGTKGHWGPCDSEITVLSFESLGGGPRVVLAFYACHPVVVQVQSKVSADFPGVATGLIETAMPDCEACLFVQGACGDINPIRGDTRDFADVDDYGRILAEAIQSQLDLFDDTKYPAESVRVAAASKYIDIPSSPLPTMQECLDEQSVCRDTVATSTDEADRNAAERRLFRLAEEIERVGWGDHDWSAEIQVIRLGDCAIIGIPGEPFAELGMDLKKFHGPKRSLCAGYSNDYLGYIAPKHEWDIGGYEVEVGTWTYVGPEAYRMMLDAAKESVTELWSH